ncbi:protein mono-ADP-ribosyltransferase PARP12-like isoform X1 [Pygocentrus nattereri]|nr:protein mono-ADP-ribosyltransferase PARP12-like isoform X1 [Pygocentrus nattereri]
MRAVMALEAVLKRICDSSGSVDGDGLLDMSVSLPDSEDLDTVIRNSDYFTVIQRDNCKKVIVRTNLKLCWPGECDEACKHLHLCRFYLLGECRGWRCTYGHSLESEHNSAVLREHNLRGLNKDQLRVLLLQSDSRLLPHVCVSYNKGRGEYGNCPDKEACRRLHICESYIRGTCDDSSKCRRSHDFYEPHPMKNLQAKGVSSQLIGSLLLIYRNIMALKDHSNARGETSAKRKVDTKSSNKDKVPASLQRNAENMICLSFVKGYCKFGERCWRIHFDMPYKWEVEVDQVWTYLPDNEAIERDYCNPVKTYSVGIEPVRFDTMTQGFRRVRRVSTESSVLEPTFVLTTQWKWYWENEYGKWIQYASVKEMHRLSSVSGQELEQKYLQFLKDSNNAVVRFTAGNQFYELNFRDMKQRNEMTGTERTVRRRPQFVSTLDAQRARASRRGAQSSSHKGVPGFWDQSAIPDSGFQRVLLSPSDKDYTRVQERFHKTMTGFTILRIERVQNREQWEDFQTKRERMRKANKDKKYEEGERLLFHGTKSDCIDAICNQNVDMRLSGANGTVYGQGSYFARDAKYSHGFTDKYGEKSMFVCRVLVGQYTRGVSSYRRPPAKDSTGTLYDSCVDNPKEPTIFVVFDRPQVYPEFLITYEEETFSQSDVNFIKSFVCPVSQSLAQLAITDITSTSKPTALTDSSLSAANGSQMASSSLEKYTITSSPTTTEPASPCLSTATASNPLVVVMDSSVSQHRGLASSHPLVDGNLADANRVVTAPKRDQLSHLNSKPPAQFGSSRLPSKSGHDLAAAVSEKSDDHHLISRKPSFPDSTVQSESAKIQKASHTSDFTKPAPQNLLQDSRKSLTLTSVDSDSGWDVLDPFATLLNFPANSKSFLLDYSPPTSVSAKASTDKDSRTGNTVQSESAKNLKSTLSSCSADFTKPAPRSFQEDSTVLQEPQTKTTHFLRDQSADSSFSVLYNSSSSSTSSRLYSPGVSSSSDVSNRQRACSPPLQREQTKKTCVVQ